MTEDQPPIGQEHPEIGVLLVDDQPLVRMGLRALVASEPGMTVIGEASEGAEAVTLARRLRPAVVLMDIRMPGTDGLTALRTISADPTLADTHVVMLTTFELDEYVFAALESGASGFLIKDADPEDIVRGIKAAASGESLLSPTVTRRVIAAFAPGRRRSSAAPHPGLADLTDREREVLSLVGQGLNNDEIAGRLFITKATARTHVSHILLKLGARDRPQLVVIAFQSGLA
ncbi:MAG TPA: response regulator transcription factor [Propioniciclava sp.]|jgi:DNA-binding NarL/FixJ family response regulator|uniref:response regulator transcription factor n=1 Tax=Propioniciclava sp. TaxID=2038686 RepID=UPI002CFACB2F|nr:response regulator transcription factor [Propioniciclava sp.]HRL48206.1 response regulator transcription factor [Propioniciclava sp.]HRL81518.1 response regulator transcription factor [Propioniciclava sp.]